MGTPFPKACDGFSGSYRTLLLLLRHQGCVMWAHRLTEVCYVGTQFSVELVMVFQAVTELCNCSLGHPEVRYVGAPFPRARMFSQAVTELCNCSLGHTKVCYVGTPCVMWAHRIYTVVRYVGAQVPSSLGGPLGSYRTLQLFPRASMCVMWAHNFPACDGFPGSYRILQLFPGTSKVFHSVTPETYENVFICQD